MILFSRREDKSKTKIHISGLPLNALFIICYGVYVFTGTILHSSAFCILHSAFCILHSAFCIMSLTSGLDSSKTLSIN